MFDDDSPSVAAILIADLDVAEAAAHLDRALAARRYLRHDTPPPRGYPAGALEWVGFAISPLSGPAGVALWPSDVGHAFELARWVSAALPDRLVIAWRRLRGEAPVAKFLARGQPQWKDGADPDHEVDWHVPLAPPAETPLPASHGLPTTAAGCSELLRPALTQGHAQPSPVRRGYLDRHSPLA